jgi:acetyl-CoA synthetase
MRRRLRDIAEGRALGDVTTLRDSAVMAALESKIAAEQAKDLRDGQPRQHRSFSEM